MNEVEEEVGIREHESFEPRDVVMALGGQPMLAYDLQTGLSFEEIAEQWRELESDELVRLVGVPVYDIPRTLNGETEAVYTASSETYKDSGDIPLRPHAKAALDTFF